MSVAARMASSVYVLTQDDAHIFCLPEQLADEITDVLSLMETVLTKFGFSE